MDKSSAERRSTVKIAANHELESEFAASIPKLTSRVQWAHLPAEHSDVYTDGLIFRLVSRSSCAIDVLFGLPTPYETVPGCWISD